MSDIEEIVRLASLVGTDAKNAEANLRAAIEKLLVEAKIKELRAFEDRFSDWTMTDGPNPLNNTKELRYSRKRIAELSQGSVL